MNRRTGRINRIGLALTGLALTAAGGAALARGLAIEPDLFGAAHTRLLDGQTRRYATDHWWFWPTIALATTVIAAIALAWLAALARTGSLHHLNLEPDPRHGITHLPARAATNALEDDLTNSPYIHRAHATLTGAPTTPQLTLIITLHPNAEPATATQRTYHAVTQLRHALETDHLTATIRIRTTADRH